MLLYFVIPLCEFPIRPIDVHLLLRVNERFSISMHRCKRDYCYTSLVVVVVNWVGFQGKQLMKVRNSTHPVNN